MLFSHFVRVLQQHFKITIGEFDLCSILFDFVIEPANLLNASGDILTIPKGTVSKIMNNHSPINTQIRDNIYNEKVLGQLVDNFEKHILPELIPELEDLCFQFMEIIRKENISPAHKAEFQLLAKPKTIASFLAKIFVYAIITNSSSSSVIHEEKDRSLIERTDLSIKGIKNNREISNDGITESFIARSELSLKSVKNKIVELYNEIAKIHLEKPSPVISILRGMSFSFGENYSVDKKKKEKINMMAVEWEISLPDDFYCCGGLKINSLGAINRMGFPSKSLNGTYDEKRKAKLIDDIYNTIIEFEAVVPYIQAFESVKCIALALSNDGGSFDNDVRIDLKFAKDELLTAEEIATFDKDALKYLTDTIDLDKQFEIPKGINYLKYDESENLIPYSITNLPVYFDILAKPDYEKEIQNLFRYFYTESDNKYFVQITIDNINPNTSVAFPSVILLKKDISEISYSIRSKRSSEVYCGVLSVKKQSENSKT